MTRGSLQPPPPNVQTKTTPLHVIQYMQLSEAILSTNTFSVSYLSCRIVLQIKNFMLTRLLVNHLQVNIAYMKIWVHLTFVLVHLRKKVRRTSTERQTCLIIALASHTF